MVYGVDPWIDEWIHYNHDVLGVGHFYIYDDAGRRGSDTARLLGPWLDAGIVTYIDWVQEPKNVKEVFVRQISAMNSCIQRYAHRHSWILVGDVDERVSPAAPV